MEFEFTPPGEDRNFLAVAHPLFVEEEAVGALIVAKPEAQLRDQAVRLVARLAIALGVGLVVTAVFAWYLSGRITKPVRRLAKAADEVAEGHYDTNVPEVSGRDEIADLADSFRQMTERLAEAEELERNFLMTVSHELRTPLTAIRGHVEALREGLVDDPETRSASLDVIAAEAGRLERLVGDVLDLAKLDMHRFTVLREEVDMARLLERAHAVFAEEAKRRGIDYEQEVDAQPVIVSDGDRVLQIITNLLANAFRWTPDGGRVDLRAALGERSDPRRRRRHGPRHRPRGARADLPALLDARRQGNRSGPRDRAGSWHSPSAVTSSWKASSGRGSRFELVLPAHLAY